MKFFHHSTMIWRRNRIFALKDEAREWIEGEEGVHIELVQHFLKVRV